MSTKLTQARTQVCVHFLFCMFKFTCTIENFKFLDVEFAEIFEKVPILKNMFLMKSKIGEGKMSLLLF